MKSFLPILLFCCFCSLSFHGCVPKQDVVPDNPYIIGDERPWVIAHGGAKKLFPENTMLAFDGSYAIGVDALEIDVCMTKDEILVCHHDLTLDRTSDGEGFLIEYTLNQLEGFNFGAKFENLNGDTPYAGQSVLIPTLQEVFERFSDVYFIVEIKNGGDDGRRAAELMRALIIQTDVTNRTMVASFHKDVMDYFLEITDGSILTSGSQEEAEDFAFSGLAGMEYMYNPQAVAMQLPMRNSGINLATKRIVNSAHRRNMAMHYWTINEKEDMELLLDLGADGLITDRPDLMWEVLLDKGWTK